MFKREAKIVSNMIIGLSDNLDRMFLPCNFISIEEINKFRNDNKDAIEAVTEEMTAQDVEKLREERRNRGKLRSFPNPLLSRNYPQFTEGVSEEGSPDDLPF